MSLRSLMIFLISTSAAIAAGEPSINGVQNRAGTLAAIAGDVIDVIGSNLADAAATVASWPLPSTLNSVQVFCDAYQAPILSVAPDRVRIQLPWELAGIPTTKLRIVHGSLSSAPFDLPLAEFAPAIIGVDSPTLSFGQTVTFRVIGLGPRNLNPATGSGPSADTPGSTFVHFLLTIGGVPAPMVNDRLATGNVQQEAGVQAVSVKIPSNVAPGSSVPAQMWIGGLQSPAFSVVVQASDIRISLSPLSAQVPIGGSQKFDSSIDGSADKTLQWSIDDSAYSLANQPGFYGTINGGNFSAFSNMTVPSWTLIRATHPSGAFATALVQLVSQDAKLYRIQPESPVIAAGESISFTLIGPDGAKVDNVVWSISDGFGNNNANTYTAPTSFPPALVNVWARLAGKFNLLYDVATTTIVIDPQRPQITGISPQVAHIGEAVTFQGSGTTVRNVRAWFSSADGSRIRSAAQENNQIIVPHGAVSGPVWMEVSGTTGADFLSPPFQITILPRLRLHATRQRVSSGESTQIVAAAPDTPGKWQPNWRADLGTIDSKGMFQAPKVTLPAFARIWACLQQNTECGTVVVEVLPFRLEPDPIILDPGQTTQLKAWQGNSEISATWQAITPNVSVTPSGKLTAGSGPFDGGLAVVSATFGGVAQTLNLSIRTAGAVANTAEFYDWLGSDNNSSNGRLALGAFATGVALHGDWMYAYSRSLTNYGGPWLGTWIDVYRLDEHRNPAWVDSVEAPYGSGNLYLEGDDLYVFGNEAPLGAPQNLLLHYDVSGGYPVLLGRGPFDGNPGAYRHQGASFSINSNPNVPGPVTLEITDYANNSIRTLPLDYDPVYSGFQATANGTSTWAAVGFYYPAAQGAQYETVVFDITGPKATPLAILPSGASGDTIVAMQDLLIVSGDVYRVSGITVALVAHLPYRYVLDFDPASKRLLMMPGVISVEDGYRVVDLSDYSNPRISAPVSHSRQSTSGKLGADYFVLINGPQNATVYPIRSDPGVALLDWFPASPWMNDVRVRDGYVYWTGPGWGYPGRSESIGIFEVDDVSSASANVVASMDRPGDQVGWAIELSGHYAYAGTDTELIVYDISSPAAPVQVKVIPAPAISIAIVGNYLYAGSNAGKDKLLLTYDLSNPANPRLVATNSLPDFAYAITAQPGWAALALGKNGLAMYSLANPSAPALAKSISGTFWGVAGDRNLLYVAADYQGLEIYDVTHPEAPIFLSQTSLAAGDELPGSYYPNALAVSIESRGLAWLATPKDGRVYGLDVREPRHPRHIAEVTTLIGVASDANTFVWNGRLFVAGNDAEFDVKTQNVGLYQVRQPGPGEVSPDRYNDKPPFAQQQFSESLKSRHLNGRERVEEPSVVLGKNRHAFRSRRPGDSSR